MEEIEVGSSVHLSDLVLPDGVVIVALTYGEDRDIPVASVAVRRGGGADEEEETSAEAADADAADEADAAESGDDAEEEE